MRMKRYNNGGMQGDPPKSPEQRAMDYLTRMYSGMYADAGQGAEAERRLVRQADPMGVRAKDFQTTPFGMEGSSPLDELQQIFSGIMSYVQGDGYKRGYNDEYLRQLQEEAQGVFQRYRQANPDKPYGHLSKFPSYRD